ncbi:sigma factor-like helix-turn-helix DNA-binding protein, partial [Pseudomonas aeruginosa]
YNPQPAQPGRKHRSRISETLGHVHRNPHESIDQWLTELTDKQREVVIRRFGLRGHESSTLEEVGQEIGLTRERVRQIQVEALKRLREILEKNGLSSDALFQ